VIGRLAGVALDARMATRRSDPRERADAARWIARNALAARGVHVEVSQPPPFRARMYELAARDLTGVLAAISVVPALVDTSNLPRRWRIALAALGVPVLDRPACDAIAAGASVVSIVT